jgi:hypothetical protein
MFIIPFINSYIATNSNNLAYLPDWVLSIYAGCLALLFFGLLYVYLKK